MKICRKSWLFGEKSGEKERSRCFFPDGSWSAGKTDAADDDGDGDGDDDDNDDGTERPRWVVEGSVEYSGCCRRSGWLPDDWRVG